MKNYTEYVVTRPGFKDGIKIRIYKTPQAMRKGYLAERAKYTRRRDHADFSDTMGIFFDTPSLVSDKAEGHFITERYGTMFLNEQFITPEILIHECCHAAFSHERYIERFGMDYSRDGDLIHEERFAYYHGWLAAEVLKLFSGKFQTA
jgi:hypothetical protein